MKLRDPLLRVALFCFAIAILLMLVAVGVGYAGSEPPQSIVLTGKLSGVTCGLGCCCGEVSTIYQGHWYGNPRYCKWFHPLKVGDVVTTRARLVR